MTLQRSLFDFLSNLSLQNNREWFTLNKGIYQVELSQFKLFCDELFLKMESFDLLEEKTYLEYTGMLDFQKINCLIRLILVWV